MLNPANRRIRTRMYGGVGGEEPRGSPLSRFLPCEDAAMPDHRPHLPATALPISRGLRGRCPACGEGKLFQGFLTLRPACESCGLDFGFADSGDGPAVFVILIGGAIVVFAALMTEVVYQPPYCCLLYT